MSKPLYVLWVLGKGAGTLVLALLPVAAAIEGYHSANLVGAIGGFMTGILLVIGVSIPFRTLRVGPRKVGLILMPPLAALTAIVLGNRSDWHKAWWQTPMLFIVSVAITPSWRKARIAADGYPEVNV